MGLIQKIALSKWGEKLYRHAADPKNTKFYACTLPSLETIVATSCYCWATARQKGIDDDRRALLQTQNVLSGVAGFALGSYLNRKTYDWGEKIVPLINKSIPDAHKLVNGLRIIIPAGITMVLMRCVTPSIVAWISGKTEEVRRAKKAENEKKLNVVA